LAAVPLRNAAAPLTIIKCILQNGSMLAAYVIFRNKKTKFCIGGGYRFYKFLTALL